MSPRGKPRARGKSRGIAVTAPLLRTWPLPAPDAGADKNDRGQVVVLGGSKEIPGALFLSALAALRAGTGKLQIGAPASTSVSLAIAIPEARVFPLPETSGGLLGSSAAKAAASALDAPDCILVGPGMTGRPECSDFMGEFLKRRNQGCFVFDAGALGGIAGRAPFPPEMRVVLTPHAGEMATLSGKPRDQVIRNACDVAKEIASLFNAVVVLKGSDTYIATPSGKYFQYTEGSVGLATSGSGDVLAGLIAGLFSRGAAPDQAAAWAVFLHGAAGNSLARKIGNIGFFARELLDEIPLAFKSLGRRKASMSGRASRKRKRSG